MKLLIVDDHPILRDGVATLLRQSAPGTTVLEAGDAASGLALVERHADLDLVVLDLMLPDGGGHRAIQEFGRRRPDLPVIVLSSSEDPQDARRALALGALGFVPKSANPTTLLAAIRVVLAGEIYVPPLLAGDGQRLRPGLQADPVGALQRLTDRQVDVLALLSEGRSNKEIGLRLGLSEKTVKVHVSAIFRTLGVVNRTQAAAIGRDLAHSARPRG